MSTKLYYTQGIHDFQVKGTHYSEEKLEVHLVRKRQRCPECGSTDITLEILCERDVRGLPMGLIREVHLIYTLHRIYCHRCHERSIEPISFLSHPKARLSVMFERTILELLEQISIRALANHYHLRWHTVKDIEKRYLQQRFATIDTSTVQAVGVDEIHIGHGQANSGFLTVVRDLESGAVIHVGDGKGVSALEGALCKLTASKLQLVAMDMANAYSTWFAEHFPQAQIVFDHFHVIKLMNDKLDHVRRRVMGRLDSIQQKQLKGLRFIFLKNNEDIPENAKNILRNLRGNFQELGDTYMFKEALRTIYRVVQNAYQANIALHRWCKLAEETLVPELKTMAKTIRDRMDGIVSYWTFGHASNASTEGFNNKIRWLIRQAYGFRDLEYFKLKIYQLPQINCEKAL
jgi:transposase